jgi:GTPase SAR1 family protein
MSITIKKNEVPKLLRPKFTVDDELDSKLNQYEITSLMNKSNFTVFLGKAGSGKSSLLISLINSKTVFKKVFHTIILFMPPNSRNSIKGGFFDDKLPEDQIFDEVTLDNLKEVYTTAQSNADEGFNTLILFDDVQKYFKGECEKFLLHMINNRRHARLSLWVAAQNYFQIPKQVRQGCTDLFIFKIAKTEMENIFQECIELHKDKFIEILNLVFINPHDFMYVNTNSQRIFSNWNELILSQHIV